MFYTNLVYNTTYNNIFYSYFILDTPTLVLPWYFEAAQKRHKIQAIQFVAD